MKIRLDKINMLLLIVIFSLTFFGFYFILLFLVNAELGEATKQVSVPIRGLIGISLISLLVFNLKTNVLNAKLGWFFLFMIFYLIRIVIDYSTGEDFYLSYGDLFFYFVSFSIIPFISITIFDLREKHLSTIIETLIMTGFAFSLAAIVLYGHFIGQVSRLRTDSVGEEVISPLALSYCSTLIISITVIYLVYNKVAIFKRLICYLAITLSIIPFFLGASRGALFALFLPFLLMLIARNNVKFTLKISFALIVSSVILVYLDEMMGSGLVRRFFGTSEAIETGSTSAIRLEIWKSSFNQFLNNPIIGDKLRVENWTGHPHNMLIEVLQTTGLLGFIPIVILLLRAFLICFRVFKYIPKYSWVAIIFIESFMQNMFSGSISSAAWFWTSIALLFSLETLLTKFKLRKT
ncbi:O-antigen ligase family protein [Pedobacter sp. Du54]|uniref:O-antigen ligase family protein n=1 Tax=Pedobacter anseongensis TaxID=3133439 RepID=UPI0030B31999